MIENKLELDIISLYDKNIMSLYSINQISKKLNKKYPYINKKVNYLIENNIMDRIILGRSHLCSLNLNNEMTIYLLILNELNKKRRFVSKLDCDLDKHISDFKKDVMLHCVIAVPNKTNKNNLFFVCEEEVDLVKLNQFSKISNCNVLTRSELIKLISRKKTDIFENHIVLYGYDRFFEFLNEANKGISKIYSPFGAR